MNKQKLEWWQTIEGKDQLLEIINERFTFDKNGEAIEKNPKTPESRNLHTPSDL